jgi:beta-mannosidase
MEKIDLNGEWLFRIADPPARLPRQRKPLRTWMPATVPGTVHTDLMAKGAIPDPFYRTNENDVQWIDGRRWLYRREFDVPAPFLEHNSIVLVAEGLDTFATIRCNGRVVGKAQNMFLVYRFEVKRALRPGRNVLEILFQSPVHRAKALEKKHGPLQVALEPHRVHVRKAQYSFGWDWGPRLTTSGIWRSIRLEAHTAGRLHDPHVKIVSVNPQAVRLQISVGIMRYGRSPLRLHMVMTGEGTHLEKEVPVVGNAVTFRLQVKNPHLWWPSGCGDQPIYTAVLSLCGPGGRELHSDRVPFGIRTVRLLQKADTEGRSFIIEINGKKIFCKGADWIPADTFLPRVSASTYERLLRMARDASMNMIRVWGGGIYEQDVFYDLCDRLGLMVWQDFMYACGEYPEHRAFLQEAKREAEQVVKRLRNHPSIVLWCGNNECEWIFCEENPGKSPEEMHGAPIFRDVLPAAVRMHDGSRPYWRSSPFGPGHPNAETHGNHHQWDVWSGWRDFGDYEKVNARFVTEFGYQAPANRSTLEKVLSPSERKPQSMVMEFHNKQVQGTERLYRFQSAHYKVGEEWDDFIYKSQLVQAEALKCAAEHWRRRKFGTAGALFWQLNDCWPVASWAVIDSELRPKAAYFYTKRFFAPVLVSFRKTATGVEVWGTNDFLQPVSGIVTLRLLSFRGRVSWRRMEKVRMPANASRLLFRVPARITQSVDPAASYLHLHLGAGGQMVTENRFFFLEAKHLKLPHARISLQALPAANGSARLLLKSNTFAMGVRLELLGGELNVNDNYVDLDPNRPRMIHCSSGLPAHRLRGLIRIKSVNPK